MSRQKFSYHGLQKQHQVCEHRSQRHSATERKWADKLQNQVHSHGEGGQESRYPQKLSTQSNGLKSTPSELLPDPTQNECHFFELVSTGNPQNVEDFLAQRPHFDVNCTNVVGLSALHIAVKKHDFNMVNYLLALPKLQIRDAALFAIEENEPHIMEIILDRLQFIKPGLEYSGCQHSSLFTEDLTPLVLAAQHGYYDIIDILLKRGHTIQTPHKHNCSCEEFCKDQDYRRLNMYKALSNPIYICRTSKDPILTSFTLCKDIMQISKREQEFQTQYINLVYQLRSFVVDLVSYCRSTNETETILMQKEGYENYDYNIAMPRLRLAIDYNQKEFVAHPCVQKVVKKKCQRDMHDWKDMLSIFITEKKPWESLGIVGKSFRVLFRIILLPFLAIFYMVAPGSQLVRYWAKPINKFISATASYLVFLVLVLIEANCDKSSPERGAPSTGVEEWLMLWVLGFIISNVRSCWLKGHKRYFKKGWNWYDNMTYILFILVFVCWFWAEINIRLYGQQKLERRFWPQDDPKLLAESIFAIVTILAIGRVLFILQLNYNFGILLVTFGKMFKDVSKFFVVFFLIAFSFASGLSNLYQYYDGMVLKDKNGRITKEQVSSFINFHSTVKTLFWSVFAMAEIDSSDIVLSNGSDDPSKVLQQHLITQYITAFLHGVYHVVIVIMALNILLAMMTNSYQKVISNADKEWKFATTQVWLFYMEEMTLPSPLNLFVFISPHNIFYFFQWLHILIVQSKEEKAGFSLNRCCYIEKKYEQVPDEEQYLSLMGRIVQQYIHAETGQQ